MSVLDGPNLGPRELFDLLPERYDEAYGDNPCLNKTLDQLTDCLGAGASILDVGCGPGGPASRLGSLGFQVTGIDISDNMIDYCKKKKIPGRFLQANMTAFEPGGRFDAILSLFSLLQMPYRDVYSMIIKMASWLSPDGVLVLASVPAESVLDDAALRGLPSDYIEDHEVDFMGGRTRSTLVTTTGLLRILQEAGLMIQNVDRAVVQVRGLDRSSSSSSETQVFITARRTCLEPLFGPHPLPNQRRPPWLLSQDGWQPFAERLTRHEFEAVTKALESNRRVLDVGSGHGELPVLIAKQLGQAYAIEPNADRNEVLVQKAREFNVEIKQGTAEHLPYGDNAFDALVSLWTLHYVDDLEAALTEMVRVVDPAAPNARLIIVQGAPDNDIVAFINRVCVPIATDGRRGLEDHQGLLLATAARVFTRLGFGDISLSRVIATCNFPEEDASMRSAKAADILTGFWYKGHPKAGEMRQAFVPVMEEHFRPGVFEIKDQAVMLVARPTVQH